MGAYWRGRLFQISKNVNRKIKKAIDRFILNAIRVATGHGISRNHGKSWNFIASGKSHGKLIIYEKVMESHGTFSHVHSFLDPRQSRKDPMNSALSVRPSVRP